MHSYSEHISYPLEITSGPGVEPVTTAQAKAFYREDRSVEDTLIDRFIVAARKALERHTGYHLVDTTFKMYLDGFRDVKIPKAPLKSGSVSIEYVDESGTTQTLAASKYNVHEKEFPASVEFLDNLPDLDEEEDTKYPVIITFKCGYGTGEGDVPDDWKTVVSFVSWLMWQRDAEDLNPLNYSMVQTHLQNYKIGRFK